MNAFITLVSGLLGLLVGSFLNVVIWRVPRRESIVVPASHCPSCEEPIAPYDNVPVASWVVLRGRCRNCETHISARYPFVELLTAALFAAVAIRFAGSWAIPAYLVLAAGLVALSAIDIDHYLLPNRIVYPIGLAGIPLLALPSAIDGTWGAFGRALIAGFVAFAIFFVIHVASPRGMGFGDVRLSAVLGLYLGWLGWGEVAGGLFCGFLYGAVIGVALIIVGKRGRKQHIPFGPFMAAGAMTFVLFGQQILDWYHGLGR